MSLGNSIPGSWGICFSKSCLEYGEAVRAIWPNHTKGKWKHQESWRCEGLRHMGGVGFSGSILLHLIVIVADFFLFQIGDYDVPICIVSMKMKEYGSKNVLTESLAPLAWFEMPVSMLGLAFRQNPLTDPPFFQGGQRTRRRRWKGCARGRRWEHYHEWMGKGVLQCSFLRSRVLGKLVVLGSFHLLKSHISLNHIVRISYNTACSLASSRQWKWVKTSSRKENATSQGCWKSLMAYYNHL